MKSFLFFLFLYCCFLSSHAQILNIERYRNYDDTLHHWKGFILSQVDLQKQQIQTFHLGLNENITFHGRKHNFSLISEVHLLKVRGRNVLSNGYAHLRANFLKRRRLSYETFAQGQYDEARGMRERYLLGCGTRLYYAVSTKTYVAIGNGFMYEHEYWHFEQKDTTTFLPKTT
ncbi:MAG: hypothetical protein NZ521_11245, partial [Flammeovirgaceae bacterium]|nr:hypothetical protein [Flammeovirgaceae bacterium]MDW8288779.1 hypothetical protein [Flammeovirgaceae bacterium]